MVAIANMGTFIHMGRKNAANSELANVQTANQAYNSDKHIFATTSDDLGEYINGGTAVLHGSYQFDATSGKIVGAPISGYDGVTWSASLSRFD